MYDWRHRHYRFKPAPILAANGIGSTVVMIAALKLTPTERRSRWKPKAKRWATRVFMAFFGMGISCSVFGSIWARWAVANWKRPTDWPRVVDLNHVARPVLDATIAMEDGQFFEHGAFNFQAIHRALRIDLRTGAIVQGGSTITQQLAKNMFLTQDRTLWRKIEEGFLALELERTMTKSRNSGWLH